MLKRIKRKIYKATHPVVGEIWMLHRVVEQRSEMPEQRELEVTPDWMEQKILEYRKKGYTFVSIDDVSLFDCVYTSSSRHSKQARFALDFRSFKVSSFRFHRFVCLTFDDGYRDNYTLAYPLLRRLEIPFTVYVSTGFIDNRLPMRWYPGECLGMSTEELKKLDAAPLCTIGAHTISHPKLDTLTRNQQYLEIAESKQLLEALLDHEVCHFSFPHGAHNKDTLGICHELGFLTAAQSWGGPIRRDSHYDVLPRIEIKQP